MARESKEMQSVTIRIPKELYSDYKKVLMEQGKIVTYDVRRYMNDVVENHEKGENEYKKKERPRLKVRSIHVLFCRVIISLWQKIKQDTSLFVISRINS